MKMKSNREGMIALAVVAKIRTRTIENPIKSRELEQTFGLSDKQIRDIVHDARRAGHAIGSGNEGYFECKNFKEWEPTRHHLYSRAMSELSLIKRVDQVFSGEQQSVFS